MQFLGKMLSRNAEPTRFRKGEILTVPERMRTAFDNATVHVADVSQEGGVEYLGFTEKPGTRFPASMF